MKVIGGSELAIKMSNGAGVIPFTVDLTEMTSAVHRHLVEGDMTPDHLLEQAAFSKRERIYVPTYIISGDFDAKWTASFGYDRKETYTEYVTKRENGRDRKVPVTRTRTVTDWRPTSGTDSGEYGVLTYAGSDLLNESVDVISSIVEKLELKGLTPDFSCTAGIAIEDFKTAPSDAYDQRGRERVHQIIDSSVERHAKGDQQKDWHWTANITKVATKLLVPICHLTYEFEGKSYNVWMSGTNVANLIADPRPVDQGRVRRVRLAFIPFYLALITAAIAIFAFHVTWVWPALVAFAALLYGFIRKSTIIDRSKRVRAHHLASRQIASSNTAAMPSQSK